MVKELCSGDSLSFEIDPSKLRGISDAQMDHVIKANQSCLLAKSKEFINHLISGSMLRALPREVCSIASFTAEYAKIYASDRVSALVGGFLMLRLINPSLVTPDAWDLVPKGTVSPAARRNLTLLSKVIQNLSNNILFGSKEEYMVPMNPFIEEYAPKLVDFYNTIINDPLATGGKEPWQDCKNPVTTEDFDPQLLEEKNLHLLHKLLYTYKGKLLDILHEELQKPAEDRDFTLEEGERFFTLLDELGAPPGEKSSSSNPAADATDNAINFLTKTEKSGTVMKRLHNHPVAAKRRSRSVWMVATSYFLHFFESSQETKPFQSLPIEDIIVQIGTAAEASLIGESGAQYLTLASEEGLAVLTCQSVSEASDWYNALIQLKSRRVQAVPVREHLSPLELRIQNHITGRKQPYELSFSSFKSDHGLAMYIFSVKAFGTTYQISKSWEDFLILTDTLIDCFPRLIFPCFPENLIDPHSRYKRSTSNKNRLKVASESSTPEMTRKLSNSSFIRAKPQKTATQSRLKLTKSSSSSSSSSSSTQHSSSEDSSDHSEEQSSGSGIDFSSSDNHIGFDQDGRPTRALIVAAKFLKAITAEIAANISTSQCDQLFTFLELDSPFRAVQEDSLEQLQYLQKLGTNFNLTNREGFSPLHLAVVLNNRQMLGHLCRFQAQIDFPDKGGNSPLMLAIKRDKPAMIDALIELGANITVTNRSQTTPLHSAAEFGSMPLVQQFIQLGANPEALDFKKRSPLVLATQAGHGHIAEFLLPLSPLDFVDPQANSLLHLAVRSKLPNLVRLLLERPEFSPAMANVHSVSPLHLVARSGQVQALQHLLQHPRAADAINLPDLDGTTPICLSIIHGHPEICALLAPRSDLTHRMRNEATLLHLAVVHDQLESVRILVEAGANIDAVDPLQRTPLHLAIFEKKKSIALLLLTLGADPNIKDAFNRFPMHTVGITGDAELMEGLLKTGKVQLNISDDEGCFPLHISIWAKNIPVAQRLIAAGADVNHADTISQETPLHVAANFGVADIVELLVAKGANVQQPQKDGQWPIHLAAMNGDDNTIHAMMIRAEVSSHILANAPNGQGRTPIQLALERKNESVALALVKHGASYSGLSLSSKQRQNLDNASSSTH